MSIIVSKFGGSSTASAEMFVRIHEIIAESDRRYIVLSAPGALAGGEKITDLLYRCHRKYTEGESIAGPVGEICRRFESIAAPLGVGDMTSRIQEEIAAAVRVSEAHAVSRGEYLCVQLFSRWTGIPMMDAARLIAFDRTGELDCTRTLRQLGDAALTHPCLIIPGFYGADPDGNTVLLTRNGSDVTGALVAAGVGADLYENWTDVPGLMSADPAVVPDARLTPQISYRQMRALARSGARVLHPDCLDPVAMAGIPTRLRDTRHPESYGTLITGDCDRVAPCVTGQERTRVLSLTGLAPEARKRLSAANGWVCHARSGEEIAVLPEEGTATLRAEAPGQPAACISVFGMPGKRRKDAARSVDSIAVLDAGEALRFVVPRETYAAGVRTLHALLMADRPRAPIRHNFAGQS